MNLVAQTKNTPVQSGSLAAKPVKARTLKIFPLTVDKNQITQAVSDKYADWTVSIWKSKTGGFHWAAHNGKKTSISSKVAITKENDVPSAVMASIDALAA